MNKTKTAVIMLIVVTVLLAAITALLLRKQTLTIGGEIVQLKSSWKKPAADEPEKPAAK